MLHKCSWLAVIKKAKYDCVSDFFSLSCAEECRMQNKGKITLTLTLVCELLQIFSLASEKINQKMLSLLWIWASYLQKVYKAPLVWMLLAWVMVRRVFLSWQLMAFISFSSQKLLVNPSLMGLCLSLNALVTFPTLLIYLHPLLGCWDEVCLEVMGMSPLPTQGAHGPGWKPCYSPAQLFPDSFICFLCLGAGTGSWTLSLCSLFAFYHVETFLLTPPGPGFVLLGVSSSFSAISAHAGVFQPLQNTQTKHSSCIHQLTSCW